MGKSKKSKKQNKRADKAKPNRVIHAGVYDGSEPSSSFVVSGHSTGSANTEMEALSYQVSRDAGAVPDYPNEDSYVEEKQISQLGSTIPGGGPQFPNLGGPELYGPHPDLLEESPLHETQASAGPPSAHESTRHEETRYSDQTLSPRVSEESQQSARESEKEEEGSFLSSLGSSLSLAGASVLAGLAAYKLYQDPKLRKSLTSFMR